MAAFREVVLIPERERWSLLQHHEAIFAVCSTTAPSEQCSDDVPPVISSCPLALASWLVSRATPSCAAVGVPPQTHRVVPNFSSVRIKLPRSARENSAFREVTVFD